MFNIHMIIVCTKMHKVRTTNTVQQKPYRVFWPLNKVKPTV